MYYTIELTKEELNLLKHIVKNAIYENQEDFRDDLFTNNYFGADATRNTIIKLQTIMGKLQNIIPIANKITDDEVSILAKRKYKIR